MLCAISKEQYSIWSLLLVHLCKMMISLDVFFSFSKFWFFGLLEGVKEQKTVQNGKKFCLSRFISQEPYIIQFSFMLHICNVIISPGGVFIFSKFWFFWVVRGMKVQKIVQNDEKFCLSCSISQKLYIIWLSCMVQMCKMIISVSVFLIFSNFDFWG